MPNDSSTGGYLSPGVASPPLEDLDLDAVLQPVVVGITGLPGAMVRPRWQPVVPKQPEPDVDWCAIGVLDIRPEDTPVLQHVPGGEGTDEMVRHELLDVLASFYGPRAGRFASMLHDGLFVPQNREGLRAAGMALIYTGGITPAPELVNQQWVRRMDLTLTLRRVVHRTYQVLNILSSGAVLQADDGISVEITVD